MENSFVEHRLYIGITDARGESDSKDYLILVEWDYKNEALHPFCLFYVYLIFD